MKKEKTIKPKEKRNKMELYTSPVVEVYGTLKELTQMPGGSTDYEGASGKIHKKDRPNRVPPPIQ